MERLLIGPAACSLMTWLQKHASFFHQAVCQAVDQTSGQLDVALDSIQLSQNSGKAEALAHIAGRDAVPLIRHLYASRQINVRTCARYLGPYRHWGGSFACELSKRFAAAKRAWFDFSRFWFKPIDLRLRVCVYRAVVLSCLLSGLTAFALGERDIARLDAYVVLHLRKFTQREILY